MAILLFRLGNILLELVFWLTYPVLYPVLRKKRYLASLDPRAESSRGGILFHAASVGEVNALRPLLKEISRRYPQRWVVITTNTVTGLKVASGLGYPAYLSVLDLPHLRKAQLAAIAPRLVCVAETELWLNLLHQAGKQNIDVAFVNARISQRSLDRYALLKPLLRQLRRPVKAILCQSAADAGRFQRLFGLSATVCGNLKYAIELPDHDAVAIRKKYSFRPDDFIVCLGSSRPGEEELLQGMLPVLNDKIPNLKLVLAVRHPQRSGEVVRMFEGASRFSKPETYGAQVTIIDEIGHLNEFYAICDLALVGGSFYDFGGHNPLEPAFYGKAILMGPYHRSCLESVNQLKAWGGIEVCAAEQLAGKIVDLAADPNRRLTLGANAKKCIHDNSESLEKHIKGLEPWLI
jgi:3-deoxy-D-manno-octulosonic-acid transferase